MARAAGATVLAAGSDLTDRPQPYFAAGVQYALLGEADHTLRELLDVLSGRSARRVDEVPGLALPDAGTRRRRAAAPPRASPSASPTSSPSRPGTSSTSSATAPPGGGRTATSASTWSPPAAARSTATGAPSRSGGSATPCARRPASPRRWRWSSARWPPDHLWFADDIFGLQPRWVAEFAREVEARDAVIPFTIQSRADLMTDVAVAGLARAGCAEVWLGAESGSQKILDAMDKGTRVEQIAAAHPPPPGRRHPRLLVPPVRLPRRDLRRHPGHRRPGARDCCRTTSASASPTPCPAPASTTWCRPSSGDRPTGRTATTSP